MDERHGSAGSNPFSIFPEEIWELVLDNVNDTEGVRSVFSEYPLLEHVFHGIKFRWLVSEMFLLIFPKYLGVHGLLTCRLASKSWRNAVGNCLETLPYRIPYDRHVASTITETHFNYSDSPFCYPPLDRFLNYFDLEAMNRNENPFPGRGVRLNAIPIRLDADWGMEPLTATSILQVLGHHLTALFLYCPYVNWSQMDQTVEYFLQPLFRCLSYLPNLKSLSFGCHLPFNDEILKSGQQRKQLLDFISSASFPFRLEKFDIDFIRDIGYDQFGTRPGSSEVHRAFMTAFVNHDNVSSLSIQPDFWGKDYVARLSNLTHLEVSYSADSDRLKRILHDLQVTPLRRLRVNMSQLYPKDVLGILEPHSIESLELTGMNGESTDETLKTTSRLTRLRKLAESLFKPTRSLLVPSVKILRIENIHPKQEPLPEIIPISGIPNLGI